MPKENANDKLKKWIEFRDIKDYENLLRNASEKYAEYCLCFQSEWTRGNASEKAEDCMNFIPDLIDVIKSQQKKIEKLQEKLNAKIMFVSNEKDEDMYALQEKVIELQKEIEGYDGIAIQLEKEWESKQALKEKYQIQYNTMMDKILRYENGIYLAIAQLEESESIPFALDALKNALFETSKIYCAGKREKNEN